MHTVSFGSALWTVPVPCGGSSAQQELKPANLGVLQKMICELTNAASSGPQDHSHCTKYITEPDIQACTTLLISGAVITGPTGDVS